MRADELIAQLRKPTEDEALRASITQLGLDAGKIRYKGGKGDLVATNHGITLIFFQQAGKKSGWLSDVMFSSKGYLGGPPFADELPRGIRFDMDREQVHALLGPPVATAMVGIPNERWDHGDRCYLTIDFVDDYSRIKKLTVGVLA